jgi:hypothetical protein
LSISLSHLSISQLSHNSGDNLLQARPDIVDSCYRIRIFTSDAIQTKLPSDIATSRTYSEWRTGKGKELGQKNYIAAMDGHETGK